MAITLDELDQKLREIPGFVPLPGPIPDSKSLVFPTEHYADDDGDKRLLIIVVLEENGEYIKVLSPFAMKAKGRHADDLLKACMMVQWKTKLVQFEYDDTDGEIRPIIEWPVEDGTVTAKQLARAITGLVQIVDRFYPVLERALAKGKIDFDLAASPALADLLVGAGGRAGHGRPANPRAEAMTKCTRSEASSDSRREVRR